MLPFATQRAPSRRATATAQGLSQGFPSASASATAAVTVAESTSVATSETRRVASSLLVAAATMAVSAGPSTLACAPSNRRLITAMAREFGKSDAAIALSITLTLAFRPVGAFIFGLVADRYGRKLPLMIDLVFYSLIEVLTGLAPNYVTFLVLRALFGIGMGAEW